MTVQFKQGGVSFSFVVAPSGLRDDEAYVAEVLRRRPKRGQPEGLALICRDQLVPGGFGMHMHRPRKNRYTRRTLVVRRKK